MSTTAPALTYSELPTVSQWLSCDPPYSFYFDLIQLYWRAPYSPISLHRLCTLARKQGANFVIVESAHGRADILEEIADLDKSCGLGGAAEAIKFTFVSAPDASMEIKNLGDEHIVGQAVLINYKKPAEVAFSCSYMFEALFRPPSTKNGNNEQVRLLNNFISTERAFPIAALGQKFNINSAYFCQQNSITHACAQSCLRMALNTMPSSASYISSGAINAHLSPANPGGGLTLGQIAKYIEDSGLGFPLILGCANMAADQYLSVLDGFVQSGMPTLLVFSTASQPNQPAVEHVVSVVGSTHNSDEWHPQAIPAYAGPSSALYRKSSLWTDHFLIHDDNFGPYYTLSSRALEVDKNVTASTIISISPVKFTLSSVGAEVISAIALNNLLPSLRSVSSNRWVDYLTSNNYQFVLRPILIKRENYISHLSAGTAHDGTAVDAADLSKLTNLPEYFWMVEFTMPALFTGNHSKLGEVLVDHSLQPNVNNIFESVYHVRLPGTIFTVDYNDKGTFQSFAMDSHLPSFMFKPIENRW